MVAPEHFINRELSWLEFNRRVLEEAQDASQPLLERVKFLCITGSNLDEFFEIRVGGIKQQIENETDDTGPDGLGGAALFDVLEERIRVLVRDQYRLFNDELVPALAREGIHFYDLHKLHGDDLMWAKKYFLKEVSAALTPLALDSSHPFPQLLNKSNNIMVLLEKPNEPGSVLHAIVQIPRVLPRLIRFPKAGAPEDSHHYFFITGLIKHFVGELFPGRRLISAHAFRVTRNSDLYIDEEESENLLRHIEGELRKRNRGNAVRLELHAGCPREVQTFLLQQLKLSPADMYLQPGPLTFLHLFGLTNHDAFAHLRDKPWAPVPSKAWSAAANPFDLLRRQDVLLHHPYESFDPVVDFIQKAADDPKVLAIKMTLYRTSSDSPVVRALIRATEKGKQVTVLIEIKARFDEENNITWARQLEEAGAHVVYGIVGLKTHCKILLVVRRDENGIQHYAHLGTGNYHPSTARFYTDIGLLTANASLTEEVATLFNTLTGLSEFHGIRKLIVAPFEMAQRFKKLIEHEAALAKAGKGGRIIAKMNSLVDEDLISALYDASNVGVKIDLIVRGICCLRPGVVGVSENIRVISIVGRFLEHSRFFYFGNAGKAEIYLGSADWMPRNLYRRVEVVFPIEDKKIRQRLEKEIIPIYLNDCVKARELQPDGSYKRLQPADGQKSAQSQLAFREIARKQSAPRSTPEEETPVRIVPVTRPG